MPLNARQQRAIQLLRANRNRDIYQTCDFFDYAITYTADVEYEYMNKQDVEELVNHGLIVLKWPNDPKVQCWKLTSSADSK